MDAPSRSHRRTTSTSTTDSDRPTPSTPRHRSRRSPRRAALGLLAAGAIGVCGLTGTAAYAGTDDGPGRGSGNGWWFSQGPASADWWTGGFFSGQDDERRWGFWFDRDRDRGPWWGWNWNGPWSGWDKDGWPSWPGTGGTDGTDGEGRPGAPSNPSTPNQPSVPNEPSVPSVPSTPNEPSVPSVPSTPNEPSTPNQPPVPNEPSVPAEPAPQPTQTVDPVEPAPLPTITVPAPAPSTPAPLPTMTVTPVPTSQPTQAPAPAPTPSTPAPTAPAPAPTTSTPTPTVPAPAPSTPAPAPSTPAPAPTTPTTPPTSSNPSGLSMPVGDLPGWRQVFADDFNGTDLSSSWGRYSGQPGGNPAGWWMPTHAVVNSGLLELQGYTDNGINASGGVAAWSATQLTYGKYDVRFRADVGTGYGYVFLLWPAAENWPIGGEIDFAEDGGDTRQSLAATLHYGADNSQIARQLKGDFTQWHTIGVEWTAGKIVYTLDGQPWASVEGSMVPSNPMFLAVQQAALPCTAWSACVNGTTPPRTDIDIDWIVAYAQK